jgi:hypothetical protein
MHISIYESRQSTNNERFIPEPTLLRVFSYLDKLVPLCQSISSDLKSRQTQHCVVMYCVVLRFVFCCVVLCLFVLCFVLCWQCCGVLWVVLCCLLGFKSLLTLNYCLMANNDRNLLNTSLPSTGFLKF